MPTPTAALPPALETLRLALNDAAEAAAAREKECLRLLDEVTALTQRVVALEAAAKLDGGQ